MGLRRFPVLCRALGRLNAGISREQWDDLIALVVEADAADWLSPDDRRAFVRDVLATMATAATASALNLTVELAVAYAKRKGMIE